MLYFLLFNIAPTIVELAAVLIIFWTKFSFGLASATALMVVVYIIFTRKVTDWRNALRTRSEEHTSELQSLMRISYAVFCLKKKKTRHVTHTNLQHLIHKKRYSKYTN